MGSPGIASNGSAIGNPNAGMGGSAGSFGSGGIGGIGRPGIASTREGKPQDIRASFASFAHACARTVAAAEDSGAPPVETSAASPEDALGTLDSLETGISAAKEVGTSDAGAEALVDAARESSPPDVVAVSAEEKRCNAHKPRLQWQSGVCVDVGYTMRACDWRKQDDGKVRCLPRVANVAGFMTTKPCDAWFDAWLDVTDSTDANLWLSIPVKSEIGDSFHVVVAVPEKRPGSNDWRAIPKGSTAGICFPQSDPFPFTNATGQSYKTTATAAPGEWFVEG